MRSQYEHYGFGQDDLPYVAAFEGFAKRMGWGRDKVDAIYQAYAAAAPNFSSPDDLYDWVGDVAGEFDIEDGDMLLGIDWLHEAAQEGPGAMNDAQVNAAAGRAAEITRIMREEPERYWGDEAMQKELGSLHARHGPALELADAPAPPPAGSGSDSGNGSAPTQDRGAEIRAIMRDDPERYYGENLDAEYATLLAGDQQKGEE